VIKEKDKNIEKIIDIETVKTTDYKQMDQEK